MHRWASILALLGLFYLFWAIYWPSLFRRRLTSSVEPEEAGYRIGMIVHWRLPFRAAAPILLMTVAPPLAAIIWIGRLLPLLLGVATVVLILVWLTTTPGTILQQVEIGHAAGGPIYELRVVRNWRRSLLVFLLLGLLPAMALGLPLGTWLAAQLS